MRTWNDFTEESWATRFREMCSNLGWATIVFGPGDTARPDKSDINGWCVEIR